MAAGWLAAMLSCAALCSDLTPARPRPHAPRPAVRAGGKWNSFPGQAGRSYTLYTDGSGARLDSTFGAGGLSGKATFIRAVAFARGKARVTAGLAKTAQGKWVLQGEGGSPDAAATAALLPKPRPPSALALQLWVPGRQQHCQKLQRERLHASH